MATKDYFLKIEGVEGESNDSKHRGEIDIESFSWGESSTVVHGGEGVGKVKVQMQDFHFTMFANKASPKLMRACATGERFPKAILTCRKAGTIQQEYMRWTFYDVLVSSFQTSGPGHETAEREKLGHEKREIVIPLDQVTLNYGEIEVEYRSQQSSGELGGTNKFRYNLKQMRVS
jgi:type VI secretion system secreted protein Hcp